jgi:hypothetical protein
MICGSSAGSYFASRDLGPSVPPNASVNDICPGSSSYPFTKNTLKVDCEGTFDLCFTVRAFNASGKTVNDATTQDCALMPRQCTGPSEYPTRDVTKALSDLKYWTSSNAACANNFTKYGGYAELSVKGQSYLCEKVDDGNNGYRVFYRIRYCSPNETNCTSGASGPFGN